MALNVGQIRRHRSSTTGSRGLSADEQQSQTAQLCSQLNSISSLANETSAKDAVAIGKDLRKELLTRTTAKDVFRRAAGFESLLGVLQSACSKVEDDPSSSTMAVSGMLSLLSMSLEGHLGNERYFANKLDGWKILQKSLLSAFDKLLSTRSPEQQSGEVVTLCSSILILSLGHEDGSRISSGLATSTEAFDVGGLLNGYESIVQTQAWNLVIIMIIKFFSTELSTASTESTTYPRRLSSLVNAVAQLSLHNQVASWQSGVVSELLAHVFSSSTTTACRRESKAMLSAFKAFGFSSLDDAALLFRKAGESDDGRALLLDFLRASKGPSLIQFDLSKFGHSSVELAELPRSFPPQTGYALTMWVRFDQFDPNTHTTLFGAFDGAQDCFVLVYLESDSRSLILQTSVKSARPSVRFKSTRFAKGKWYHITIVHRKSSSDSNTSPAMLFVNGDFAEQVKCGYPGTPATIKPSNARSSPGPNTAARPKPVQAFFGTPSSLSPSVGKNLIKSAWSLAAAHFYQSPLTDEFVAVHYRLGPRYQGNLQDCLGPLLTYRASAELNRYNELLHPDKSEKSDIVAATENRGSDVVPEARVLFSLLPTSILRFDAGADDTVITNGFDRAAKDRLQKLIRVGEPVAINAAIPQINEAIKRPYGVAVLKGQPVVALPKALDDASWCLAGCLPLLMKLLDSASTKMAFLQTIEILFECVKDSWRISEAMEKGNGFGILAMIIREKLGFESGASVSSVSSRKPSAPLSLEDRQTLPQELLRLVLGFVGYDQSAPENSMIVNPMGYRVLLIDFDTWRRCDADTQRLYYEQFAHFVLRNKHHGFNHKRLSRMRVVKRLVDALKTEDVPQYAVEQIMAALRALLDGGSAQNSYKDLAMFVAYGLQDERATHVKPMRMASTVKLRQRAASWARKSSRPGTPGGAATGPIRPMASRSELAISVLEFLANVVCDESSPAATRRFARVVPTRYLLHLLSEPDVRVVTLTLRIICRSLGALGSVFKSAFVDKNGGFTTLKARLKPFWRSPALWTLSFAMLFGRNVSAEALTGELTIFGLLETLQVDNETKVLHPEALQPVMTMLEAALRDVVKSDEPVASEAKLVRTIVQLLSELFSRCAPFREFATTSRYIQEVLFVLYPVVVGSDRLSAETEYQAEKDTLSFKGEEVVMRPHSNSVGERPPSVRSLNMDGDKRTPSPNVPKRIAAPRRLSSFVLVNPSKPNMPPARFSPALSPRAAEPVKLNVGNSLVESLLEVVISLFIDLIGNKKDFNGLGLFLKVPSGFREHQAYCESYVLVHTLSQLWNHLQLDQRLLQETKVLTNLGRFCLHMAEAVFEGWFINGAQPVIDFIGKVLDFLQQPDIASIKNVRLCAQATNTMRIVFLRVMLLRLSELDEVENEAEAIAFLNQMNYWQTILFSAENQETPFIRLICYLLYMKLTSGIPSVRLAAARLWRTMLVQKPTETATLLTYAMGSEQRHLSTGFMKLVSLDDEEFVKWIGDNRPSLDTIFGDALSKAWEDFVSDENRRNEESAKARLSKRRERLRQWQAEETSNDDFMNRYETSTSHWRANVHAQERLKLQRATQDHQENVHHLLTVFARLEKQLKQPGGFDASSDADTKWQLDETEGVNRMRMRMLPDTTTVKEVYQSKRKFSERRSSNMLAINTQVNRNMKDDVLSSVPNTPIPEATDGASEQPEHQRPRSESISNSQLLEGGFEMIDDPNEDEGGMVEDKNRKVMTSLQRGDMVQQLYNISRIVGLEACEGLLVVGKKCLYLQDSLFQRSDGEIVSVGQAPEDERDPYVQLISGKDIGTQRTRNSVGDQANRHWDWAEVLSISKRRFLFRDVSLEVFFTDGRSYLLTCMSTKVRDDLYSAIMNRAPHVHSAAGVASEDAWRLDNLRNPEEAPQTLGSRFANVFSGTTVHAATKKWIKGEMSNFQYLMLINTMAGRSFNDLTQYPVFPWVLADYNSDELDLTNPKTFRDFSKPMGCQTPAREAEYKDRYKQFAEMGDENAPPFNYGTHYSSAMIVTSYLIRLQPFVQSYLLLQGGNFDHADRLFDSIEKAWLSASKENMTDVRELTPEFYYLPEFLTNVNQYDFGVKQGGGETVSDVKLPPWAKGDPHVFIAKHREALESPFVSEHLHQWIDLVFGFKQRGEAAIEATNVFQHLSYGGAKNLDTISDPVERLATIGIIHSFGQTPHQVFQRPHAGRETEKFATARLDTMVEALTRLPSPLFESGEKVTTLLFPPAQERLLCAGPNKLDILPNCDRYLQWGFADHSLRFFSSNTKRPLGLYENTHIGPVTTAIFADSKTLITAGADCTLAVWTVSATRDAIEINPKTYLFGHRAPVTVLAVSRVFSTLLSVSADGQVLLWDLNRHDCVRVLLEAGGAPIQAAHMSSISGHILLCRGPQLLLLTLNGHLLLEQKVSESPDDLMYCCAFYNGAANEWVERELVFTGHAHGIVNAWSLTSLADGAWYLQLVNRLNHNDPSREDGGNISAAMTAVLPMPNAVYTGDEEGRVWEWDVMHRQPSLPVRGRP